MRKLACVPVLVFLAACGPSDCGGGNAAGSRSGNIPYRLEEYCEEIFGVRSPLRQTIVLLDSKSIQPAANAVDFAATNAAVRDLVLSLADAEQLVRGGASEPRERVSIYLLPSDGSSPELLFTGCPPGFSAEEERQIREDQSAVTKGTEAFFATGKVQQAEEAADGFRTRLLGALLYAGNAERPTDAPGAEASSFVQSAVGRSLAGTANLIDLQLGIPRIILVTDLAKLPLNVADEVAARALGFSDAETAHLDLRRSELHVVGTGGGQNSAMIQGYAEAFFLGSHARLVSVAGNTLPPLPPSPVRVEVYSGQIDYGPYQFPMQARLAFDRNNTLVNSWVVVAREGEVATPLTGSATCDAGGICRITSDDSGFAQAWSLQRGPEPDFGPALPFGGLRYVEMTVGGDGASGRVFDPVVSRIGDLPDLKFELARVPEGGL